MEDWELEDLMRAFYGAHRKRGDQAFDALTDRLAPWTYRRAKRILKNSALAEEAVQEAWINVAKTRTRPKAQWNQGSVQGWIGKIVHRACIDLIRRERKSQEGEQMLHEERFERLAEGPVRFAEIWALQHCWAELARDHPKQAAVMELYMLEDQSWIDIAEHFRDEFDAERNLASIANTLKSRYRRASERLAACFENRLWGASPGSMEANP